MITKQGHTIRKLLGTIASTLAIAVGVAEARLAPDKPTFAADVVYHDMNGNQSFDAGERRVSGIRVSNGREIVRTDGEGRYRLPIGEDTILFVIKPRGWRTPVSEDQLPQFYYIHKPNGSPALRYAGVAPTGPLPDSVDFPLYPQTEPDTFKAILFADPQPTDQRDVDYVAHDVVEELIGTDASFGMTLGDIMNSDLSLFGSQNRTIALLGIPWYNVIGNHDLNYDAKNDQHSDETFERVFGPSCYSFDYGTVHFLVVDDVEWYFPHEGGEGTYRGGLGERQFEFIRNDLAMIPEEQLVVVLMHIQVNRVWDGDRQKLFRLIEQRPFCMSISGHAHRHEHLFIAQDDGWRGPEPHHHVVNVTVSGCWWKGGPDERGIPHAQMTDGTPNGYSIINFDGHEYTLDYKAAGRPADYQVAIHAPEVVSAAKAGETDVFVNVFNGSERSRVELQFGEHDAWTAMERSVRVDPGYKALYDAEMSIKEKFWKELPEPGDSIHLWRAKLPSNPKPGTHLLTVRTTDMHGRTYVGRRIIRVSGPDGIEPKPE
jgi:hypothetical protein